MKLYFHLLFIALCAVTITSCSDETEPNIGMEEDKDVVTFNLTSSGNESLGEVVSKDVEISLTDAVRRISYTFMGRVNFEPKAIALDKKGAYICGLKTGENKIPDGTYFVKVMMDNREFGGRNLVGFKDGTGKQILFSQIDYSMLEGSGTSDNPYLINDAADLMSFLYYLGEDEYHGFGLNFKQTGSFDCPRRSEIIDGRSWTSTYFQGKYDGAGNEIRNLAYIGGGSEGADDNIGLFRGLFDASVSNLKITGAIVSGAGSNVGLLAGVSEGNTEIQNVSVNGTLIAQGSNIGGLVGNVTGSLSLTDISFTNLAISGSDNVGGLVGAFNGDILNVDGVSAPNHIFSISGRSSVGGVAGYVETREKSGLSNITLEHSVDAESSDVKIISAGEDNAGGIVGKMAACDGNFLINCTVKCPVSAKTNAGGVVGNLYVNTHGRFSLEKILLSSVVHAGENGGGFFGRLAMADSKCDTWFHGKENTIRYVVKNSAEAHVKGTHKLGAIAGSVTGRGGKITFDTSVEIAVNVKGTGDHIGGAFGYMENTTMSLNRNLNFSSATMRVEGDGNIGGIIGYANECEVEGLNKIDITKKIPTVSELYSSFGGVVVGKQDTGGIAGFFIGKLSGVYSVANVTSSQKAGGIVGRLYGEMRECAFGGKVTGVENAGGIAACANGEASFYHCVNLADISGGNYQGGIIAYLAGINSTNSNGTGIYCYTNVWYCANKGKLTGGAEVGGIVGHFFNHYSSENIPLKYCVNYGDIKGAGDNMSPVGGIVATFNCQKSKMSGCANHGNVSSSEVQRSIGGVVGFAGKDGYNTVIIQQCMNSGTVSSEKSSTKIGGVVGHIGEASLQHDGIVRDCYNIGAVPSDQKSDTGGILGYAASFTDTHRTFNRGKVSHGNAIIGTHAGGSIFYHSHNYYLEGTGGSWPSSTSVKSADIAKESKYGDFDFENVWKMTPDGPILRDCPFQ